MTKMSLIVKLALSTALSIVLLIPTIALAQDDSLVDCETFLSSDIADVKTVLNSITEEIESHEDILSVYLFTQLVAENCFSDHPFVRLNSDASTSPSADTSADTTDGNADSLGASRSSPVPLGEAYAFSDGTFTILDVSILDESPSSGYDIPDDRDLVELSVSFFCDKPNDETCRGVDVGYQDYITVDGSLYSDSVPIYTSDVMSVGADGHEVFPGGTIEGVLYIEVPKGESPNLIRKRLGTEAVFFSLRP